MIRTHIERCKLKRELADELNRESGSIYTQVLIFHWRTFRHTGHWLSQNSAERWNDRVGKERKLHAHSIDAAQQGFYKGCTIVRSLRKQDIEAKFPYHRRWYRTTIWKQTGIRIKENKIHLSRSKGNDPIVLPLPERVQDALRILEVRLVYEYKARRYFWHLVYETGKQPQAAPGSNIVSVDLGEIHPAVVGDESTSEIITCRERRHKVQGFAKRLAKLQAAMQKKQKRSRAWHKLRKTKIRLRAKHQRVLRDLDHKISRSIVDIAVERKAEKIVMGDVRDIADGVNLSKQTNQKISNWTHGKVRNFTEYKAQAEGIAVELIEERYTSQTCPQCGTRHKPTGRRYKCSDCGFIGHRDVVGQINILSKYKHGENGKLKFPEVVKHRIPHNLRVMRRRQDTGYSKRSIADV